ncbi:hypothetical protein HFD88_007460 [Aspergillus terreus]|nr:hypothetical protein HFD88_007460 [Aspergillus terreus]
MSAEGQKLRGSCHACAASKVRCSKEKPICSRCSKRGTTCEYLITKRPGRKQLNNRSTAKESSNTSRTSLATVPQGLLEPDPMSTAIPLADQPPWSPPGTTPSSLDVFSSLFDSAEGSWSLPLADWDNEVDEYLTHLAMPRTANSEPLDAEGGITSSHNTSSNSPARPPGDIISLFSRSAPSSRASPSPRSRRPDNAGEHRRPSSCTCLNSALDLLKRLTTSDPRDDCTSGAPQDESTGGRRSIDAMIQINQQTMDQIYTMLYCGCSEDSYLQAVVALIIFKALDRYAMAVSRPVIAADGDELRTESEAVVGGAAAVTDSRLSAAQRVLGELHRVQRVLNQLSQRSVALPASDRLLPSKNASSAVSTIVMDHLERELRKQLGTLSSEIIKMLQLAE